MKIVLLFISLLKFTILSAQGTQKDQLIGKWQLHQEIEGKKDTSSECRRKTTLTFHSNGTCEINDFVEESEIDDICISEKRKSSWKNLGDSNYRFGNKKTIKLTFENDTFYYTLTIEDYKTQFVYKKIEF